MNLETCEGIDKAKKDIELPIHKWHLVYDELEDLYDIYQGEDYLFGQMEILNAYRIVRDHNIVVQKLYDTINQMDAS